MKMMNKIFNIGKRRIKEDYTYIIAKEQPFSYTTESYQKAIINLEYANIDNKYKVLQFTSTLEGEGKTTTIVNLAYLLAQRGKKVLLMDLDLRKSKLHRVFNVPNDKGLNNYLLDKIQIDELVQRDEELNLDFIVTGERTTSITNILTSKKLEELIKDLKEEYDYVLVDSPPILAVSDSLFITKLVDGIVTIVAQNRAVKKDIKEAYSALRISGTPVIGSILTQVKFNKREYAYYTYEQEDDMFD